MCLYELVVDILELGARAVSCARDGGYGWERGECDVVWEGDLTAFTGRLLQLPGSSSGHRFFSLGNIPIQANAGSVSPLQMGSAVAHVASLLRCPLTLWAHRQTSFLLSVLFLHIGLQCVVRIMQCCLFH